MPYHRSGVRFSDEQPAFIGVYEPSSFRPVAENAYSGDYGVPAHHGAPTLTTRSMSSSLVPIRTTAFELASALRPLAHNGKASAAPGQSATQPAVGSLILQLPQPFGPMRVAPAGTDLHVTVHDVWGAARRFIHMPASRDELEALPETDRRRVKEAYFQRVRSNQTPDDGLRRGDFLCGATVTGFVLVADTPNATIAFSLGKAP